MGALRMVYNWWVEEGCTNGTLERGARPHCPVCTRPGQLRDELGVCAWCLLWVHKNGEDDLQQPPRLCTNCWREAQWGP